MNRADKKACNLYLIGVLVFLGIIALFCAKSYGATITYPLRFSTDVGVDSVRLIWYAQGAGSLDSTGTSKILGNAAGTDSGTVGSDSINWYYNASIDETLHYRWVFKYYYAGEPGPFTENFVYSPRSVGLSGLGTNSYVYFPVVTATDNTLAGVDMTARWMTGAFAGFVTSVSGSGGTFTLPLDSFYITGYKSGYSFETDTIVVSSSVDTGSLSAALIWSSPTLAGGNLSTAYGLLKNLHDSAVVGATVSFWIEGAVSDTCDTSGLMQEIWLTETDATGAFSTPLMHTDCMVNDKGKNPVWSVKAEYQNDNGQMVTRTTTVAVPSDSATVKVTF